MQQIWDNAKLVCALLKSPKLFSKNIALPGHTEVNLSAVFSSDVEKIIKELISHKGMCGAQTHLLPDIH